MDFVTQYNSRSPGVKRLMREAWEMRELTQDCSAAPADDNLFEWHFTIRGAADSDFEGGVYHGRIVFPTEYPMKPPNILLFTPNGRFEINKKICLSISGHHPETWQPSWSVRTALLALIAFMPSPASGTVGSLDYSKEERQELARKSRSWKCDKCGIISNLLLPLDNQSSSSTVVCETKKIDEPQNQFQKSEGVAPVDHVDSCETKTNIQSCGSVPEELAPQVTDGTANVVEENKAERMKPKNATEMPTVIPERFLPTNTGTTELDTRLWLERWLFPTNALSNFSNSNVTVSIIVLFIAILLYRRLFLLN